MEFMINLGGMKMNLIILSAIIGGVLGAYLVNKYYYGN